MIRTRDRAEAHRLHESLREFNIEVFELPGLNDHSRDVLVAQIIESQRRVKYMVMLRGTNSWNSVDPYSDSFDPLKAAVINYRTGMFDEACWLVFLSVHFGHHRVYRWALSKAFYGRLGHRMPWTWQEVSRDPTAVVNWLEASEDEIRALDAGFGNHRKYQTIKATGTGLAISTYVEWVGTSHAIRFDLSGSPTERFSQLYDSLRSVSQFGRTGRFDYLTTLGKLGLTDIVADRLYLSGATGPLRGAHLLMTGSASSPMKPRDLDTRLVSLCEWLGVSCDILEDALCNWQKSPNSFRPFRG